MNSKTILLVIVVVIVIALAVMSAVHSFGRKDKPVDASKAVAPVEDQGGPGGGAVFSPETAPKKPTGGR